MVKVSVVVPVYNPGEYIEPLLESLLAQSLPAGECEFVFVDDGSTDGTAQRLEALAAEHAHVRFAAIPPSGWPGRPRNTGIDLARGEYVFLADHDDRLGLEALERLFALAVADEADIVIGKVVGHGKGVPRDVFRRNRHGLTAADVPFSLLAPHKLFRRAFLDEHGLRFPEGPRRLEDHAFVVPAFFAARRISILADYPCYHWDRRPDAGNASLRQPDIAAYFRNVSEVLDIVDARTEPGPLRDRLYLRWYRGKLLGHLARPGFARADAERRRASVEAALGLARERFPPELDARLSYAHRLRAAMLRREDADGLAALARYAAGLRATARVRGIQGDGTWLTLQLAGRLSARGEPDPLRFSEDGAGQRFHPPEVLRDHLTDAELDATGALPDPASVVFLKSLADGSEWDLPTERRIRLIDAAGGMLRPQVRMLARIAPTIAAAGAPLPPGTYEVHSIVAVAGFSAAARATHHGEPLLVTVSPSRRLEPFPKPGRVERAEWAPLKQRARRRLARAARRIPGLVPAIRRTRSRIVD